MYGSAGFATVMKFLSLPMGNEKSVLENIKDNTQEAKELLSVSGMDADELREQFLTVFKPVKQQVTSSKIKQIFFPLQNGQYHLLSVLTPSTLVYELKTRLTAISSNAAEMKKQAKKEEITEPFWELYNLTRLKYGGSNPQNISQLNTENGGISKLLFSTPPSLKDLQIRIPKKDFFKESLNIRNFKYQFECLHKVMTIKVESKIPLDKQRKWRDRILREIIDGILEIMFAVRDEIKTLPNDLNSTQKIWLNPDNKQRSLNLSGWEKTIAQDMTMWIINGYGQTFKEQKIILGNAEYEYIKKTITALEELWK